MNRTCQNKATISVNIEGKQTHVCMEHSDVLKLNGRFLATPRGKCEMPDDLPKTNNFHEVLLPNPDLLEADDG